MMQTDRRPHRTMTQTERKSDRGEHVARDALLGAAAGLAATWLMGEVTSPLYQAESDEARKKEQEARGGKSAYGVAAKQAAALAGRELSDEERQKLGSSIHWVLGAGAGAVYGALRPRVPWISAAFGTLYGAMFYLAVDEGANTLLGLTPPPQEFPWETHARGLAGHVAFGVTSEAVLRWTDAA